MLNGNTIELGVCYYPEHWDTSFWKEDMLRMKSYGIGVIRVAEFAWNLFEPSVLLTSLWRKCSPVC